MIRNTTPWLAMPGYNGVLVTCVVLILVALAVGGTTQETAPIGRSGLDGAYSGVEPTHEQNRAVQGSPGPAENTVKGEVAMATQDAARGVTAQSMHGVTHYRLNVVGGAPFELQAQRDTSSLCTGPYCVKLPDFDIAFFREHGGSSASVVERHYNEGPEQGRVPNQADFAHIYLRTPGLVPDNVRGYSFVYLQGNPGSDRVPDWP